MTIVTLEYISNCLSMLMLEGKNVHLPCLDGCEVYENKAKYCWRSKANIKGWNKEI